MANGSRQIALTFSCCKCFDSGC